MLKSIRSRSLILVAALSFAAGTATTACSQTSASSAATPPTSTAATPASGDAASPSAKKVWTNEDVGALRDEPISTVGKPGARPTGSKPIASGGKNSQQILNQITKLKEQIPPLDGQIAQLQAAISGQPTGDTKSSARPYGVRLNSWQAELDELKKKRDDTLGRIAELEDEARHNGVPANNIP